MIIGAKELLIILVIALIVFYVRKPRGISVKKSLGLERITPAEERRIGSEWVEKLRRKEGLEPEKDPRVRKALQRLLAAGGSRFKDYRLLRQSSPVVNAMALPGGHVLTTTGLMGLKDLSEEELAGILAHEMGHIELGHSCRVLVRTNQKHALKVLLSIIGRSPGMAANLADSLLELGISREAELEADDFAVKRLRDAGYSPRGLVAFFKRARRDERLPAWAGFLSTHPALDERIERLERQLEGEPLRA